MVMKSIPFNNSSYTDPYYSRLCKKDSNQFWKIFPGSKNVSQEFKGKILFSVPYLLDLIEKMMRSDPTKRITIYEIKSHPWYLGPVPSYEEVKAEMSKRTSVILASWEANIRNAHTRKLRKMKNLSSDPKFLMKRNNTPILQNLRQKLQHTAQEINLQIRSLHEMRKHDKQASHHQIDDGSKENDVIEKPTKRRSSDPSIKEEKCTEYQESSAEDTRRVRTKDSSGSYEPPDEKIRTENSRRDPSKIRRSESDD